MDARAPVVRASYGKLAVGTAKRLPGAEAERALSAIGDPLRTKFREARPLEWLPASDWTALAEGLEHGLGPAGARAFWRANMRDSLKNRLLTPLRLGALNLYGKNPGSLIRMTPQAWKLVTDHCGHASVDVLPDRKAVLRFVDLPPLMRACPALLHMWAGGCEECAAHVGMAATVTAIGDEMRAGIVTIVTAW